MIAMGPDNRLQELAASTRLGIPVTISTDPRHSFTENPGAAMLSGPFSQWPDALGLAATRDEELVRTFGDIARQEYTAMGIRVALHPQVDVRSAGDLLMRAGFALPVADIGDFDIALGDIQESLALIEQQDMIGSAGGGTRELQVGAGQFG